VYIQLTGSPVTKISKTREFRHLRRFCRIAKRPFARILATTHDIGRDTRAGVLMLMAFSLLALAAASGAAIDFARGLNFKLALQAATDAAALAGATEYLNTTSSTKAKSLATSYITNALNALPPSNTVTTNVTTSVTGTTYTVVVTATASIKASFLGVIENTIPVSVSSTASSDGAPNINFYMLLDSSPSMAIVATSAGISTLIANTQSQCDSAPSGGSTCGCGFACHETNSAGDSHCNSTTCGLSGLGNPGGEDNYQLARNLGLSLRIDLMTSATQNLMTTAATTEVANKATYGMAIYTFDTNFTTYQTLTTTLSAAEASAGNIQMLEVYQNNWLTSSNNNSDEDTNYNNAMTNINSVMPAPGYGTNAPGDTPQEVLFLVTDGVEDDYQSSPINPTSGTPGREEYLMNKHGDWCTTIKNRGIRIAVLYTEYLPIPNNGWYQNFDGSGNGVSSFQSQIAANMQSCASAGLFFQVDVDGDISAAMAALFQSAVKTAYLTH
jgi:Flp pilus assembly protein TadG